MGGAIGILLCVCADRMKHDGDSFESIDLWIIEARPDKSE